ncbi:hypothetical protein [Dethiothermospora halolimnae]|uniref:hypothetical protein n=1 Tax=Dethiothermospora halolimnae TaxID=3114390 RepID=UPI003CCBD422
MKLNKYVRNMEKTIEIIFLVFIGGIISWLCANAVVNYVEGMGKNEYSIMIGGLGGGSIGIIFISSIMMNSIEKITDNRYIQILSIVLTAVVLLLLFKYIGSLDMTLERVK